MAGKSDNPSPYQDVSEAETGRIYQKADGREIIIKNTKLVSASGIAHYIIDQKNIFWRIPFDPENDVLIIVQKEPAAAEAGQV